MRTTSCFNSYNAFIEGSFVFIPLGETAPAQRLLPHNNLEDLVLVSDFNTRFQHEGQGIIITNSKGSNGHSFILRQGYDVSSISWINSPPNDGNLCPFNEDVVYRNCRMESVGQNATNNPVQKVYFISQMRYNLVLWMMQFYYYFT